MRTAITALTEELRRLKAAGVRDVTITEDSLKQLHKVVKERTRSVESIGGVEVQPKSSAAKQPATVSVKDEAKETALPSPPVVELPEGDKKTRWTALREIVLKDETCASHVRPGKQVVFGVGDINASIMFVGEAPGAEEEKVGEPFVGPAGQLLTKMIGAMGLQRSEVYIGNIMNWRPQMPVNANGEQYGNRPPDPEEMAFCLPYLCAQIEVVKPRVIVALGATAAHGLLGQDTFRALREVRGKWKEFAETPLMVTYHPSYILRNQSNRSKRMIWEDLLQVMERVELPISEKQQGYFLGR